MGALLVGLELTASGMHCRKFSSLQRRSTPGLPGGRWLDFLLATKKFIFAEANLCEGNQLSSNKVNKVQGYLLMAWLLSFEK